MFHTNQVPWFVWNMVSKSKPFWLNPGWFWHFWSKGRFVPEFWKLWVLVPKLITTGTTWKNWNRLKATLEKLIPACVQLLHTTLSAYPLPSTCSSLFLAHIYIYLAHTPFPQFVKSRSSPGQSLDELQIKFISKPTLPWTVLERTGQLSQSPSYS